MRRFRRDIIDRPTRWLAALTVIGLGTGCPSSPGPTMQLATSRPTPEAGCWWSIEPDGIGAPIVAVEQRLTPGRTRQWLIDCRGVRRFEFQSGRQVASGPPVPSQEVEGDFATVASLIAYRFGAAGEPGWPGPALPKNEAIRLSNSTDLMRLLDRHWPATRTEPPTGLSYHDVRLAMDAADVSLASLLKSGM